MCRFLIGVGAILLLFALICTAFGSDAFMWVLIISFVGAGLALALMPRKGPQHAYENWYRLQALIILLVICGLFAGFMWLVLYSAPTADAAGMAIGGFTVALSGAAYAYGHLMAPPTGRRGWLRRRYPAVAQAIRRYQKPTDLLEDYTPVLVINGKRYFLIAYHARKDPTRIAEMLLVNEKGERVVDRELVRRAAKCKSLALDTIDYHRHQERAQTLQSVEGSTRGLQILFSVLKHDKKRFEGAHGEAAADLARVLEAEAGMYRVLETTKAMTLVEAEWAAKHGLGRLVEVRDEDAAGVESQIQSARQPALEAMKTVAAAGEPARRLAEVVDKMDFVPQRRVVRDALLGMADGAGLLNADNEDVYGTMTEPHWQAWRDRMAWADEVDARLAGKAKQQAVK